MHATQPSTPAAEPRTPLSAPRCVLVMGLALGAIALAALLPAFPQPAAYHDYADKRVLLGVPHFWTVASNAAFLVVGMLGLRHLRGARQAFVHGEEHLMYRVMYAGVLLTAFGSAWYHVVPENATLAWDRAGMAVAFSALLAAALTERGPPRLARPLLAAALAGGVGSVVWWRVSEALGAENLWPYLAAQGGYIAALLALLAVPSRYTRRFDLLPAALWYGLALVLERLDRPVYEWTGALASGHTLKHVAAAIALYWVLRMLRLRRPAG